MPIVDRAPATITLAAPFMENASHVFSFADFPINRYGQSVVVDWEVTTDPDGQFVSCTSKADRLRASDDLTCSIIRHRAHFTPARDAAGKVFGKLRGELSYTLFEHPDHPARQANYDIVVIVSRLPGHTAQPLLVKTTFVALTDGRIGECVADKVTNYEQLALMACGQLRKFYRPTATYDRSKQPVSSVQSAVVAFAIESMLKRRK